LRVAIDFAAAPVGAVVKIVVGLGNPGAQYEKTRHNIGWMVLDRLADRAGWSGGARTRDAAAVVQGRYNGLDLLLVKPLTFMNESGWRSARSSPASTRR
jgi:PTH1 family peptidyl-tRNA hydrolase